MSATINIFDSAFNDNHRTIKVDSGLRIEEVENLDWENTLIYVNGFERKKEYKLREGDVATLRQFPSDTRTGAQVAGWFLMPLTSAIHFFTSGSNEGALLWAGNAIDNAIREALAPDKTDTDINGTEKIPTINGAKNRNGANATIPLLLGESMFTPITLAQAFTTISGADGENQFLHALYCLGYKDIDLKSVSLGIYELTHDEHDGTSGSLDVTNTESYTSLEDVNIGILDTPIDVNRAPMETTGEIKPINDKVCFNQIESVQSIESYDISATAYSDKNGSKADTQGTPVSVSNVGISRDGKHIEIEVDSMPQDAPYVETGGMVTAKCEVRHAGTGHYPYSDSNGRKGYYQQLELQQTPDANGHCAEVSLYPQKVIQEDFGVELMHPENVQPLSVQPFSAKYPQKIELEVMFQNLVHYDDKGKMYEDKTKNTIASVDICVGYSLDGGQTYLPFPAFDETGSIDVTDEGTYTDSLGSYRITRFKGCKNKNIRFTASKTFSFNEVFDNVKNNVIEFRIFRKSVDESITDTTYQYKCYFNAIRTWCYDYDATKEQYEEQEIESLVIQRPVIAKYRDMTARLGFTIRAGDELKGTIDELNVRMMSRARYCTITEENGEKVYTWSGIGQTRPTNNPASLALMVLQHQMRGEYAYVGEQGEEDKYFDMDSFGRFYEWCEQTDTELLNSSGRKYTCNGVLSKQMKTIDLVNQILNCGHGKLIIIGNKYGVLYDKPDIQPVMVLNNQNVLDAKNSKNFVEDIDGYSCKFIDSLNDYQEDTQIFVPKDIQDPTSPKYKPKDQYKLESLELPWTTDVKRAYRMAMYMLACRKLRPETWEVKMSVDGALVDVGSLVSYQSDTIAVGIGDGAQITEVIEEAGYITGVKVDYGFTVADTTKTYGIKVQHSDPTNGVCIRTYQLEDFSTAGIKDTLVFDTPIDVATLIKPTEGDVVSFGLYEKITTDAVVFTKKSNQDGTYVLTLVPYQDNIYDAEYGTIPEYVSNVTSPLDAGVEVSEELPPVTREDVGDIAEAVFEEGTDEPPSAPTGLSVIAEEHGIQIKWIPVEDNGINNTIKQYDVELTRDGGTTWIPFVSTYNSDAYYTFRRTASIPPVEGEYVDGYPEATDFADWQFRVKAVNIYGYESTWLTTGGNVNTQKYGTWVIPALSATQEILDRTAIVKVIHNAPQRPLYGSQRLQLKIKRLGSDDPTYAQQFNTMLAITPDTQWYTPNFNDLVGYSDTEDNEPNYRESGSGWYTTDLYQFSHTLPLIGQTPRIYKANDIPLLSNGVSIDDVEDSATIPESPSTGDLIRYTGTTTAEYVHNGYYLYDGTAWTRLFSKFTKDVPDVNELPSSPTAGQVVHLVSDGFYYLYEDNEWVQVFSKSNAVATTYQYLIQMTNESGNVTAMSEPVKVTVLPTNISDIVHSHEHYKDLYVEKLSAISANIGMITQGGMGSFEDALNYWALSDLSAQDSGVNGGVKKGAFRVGGRNEYFKVTPLGNDEYKIELKAGNIELTSNINGGDSSLDFTNGTYVYSPDRKSRMALSYTGITAQKQRFTQITPSGTENPAFKGWYELINGEYVLSTDTTVNPQKNYYVMDWQTISRVVADSKGNMIITNDDKPPTFGYQVSGDVYHIEDINAPFAEEVGTGVTPSNPQSLSGSGSVIQIADLSPIVVDDSSKYCYDGEITKDVSNFTGNVVFMSKADAIRASNNKAVYIDGTVDSTPDPLTGYNSAMRETSTIESSMTVGAYLGLSQEQIDEGIFN